jgi:hypothetical protein
MILRMGTYNVISAWQNRLKEALRSMESCRLDLGIMTETKLTDDIYTDLLDIKCLHHPLRRPIRAA